MLPANEGTAKLSPAAREKLEGYYQRFCEGANGERYGMGAMVCACHMAFPLLLSADLANMLWLNFNVYMGTDGMVRKVDRIHISDLLLSPLVRPAGAGQFECIPEIRTWLLWLLRDGRWLRASGVDIDGSQHLADLAYFLRAYLADKRSGRDNRSTVFRELNEWASLCYLEPNLLAARIAEAYQKTFSRSPDVADDETGQLRLNMLMDRFGQQLDRNVHAETAAAPTAFVNLRRYSLANKARLFERGVTEVSDLFFSVDKAFIGGDAAGPSTIELPVLKGASERLKRKKENIQRVFAVFVETHNTLFPDLANADYLSSALSVAASGVGIQLRNQVLKGDYAGFSQIELAIRTFTAEMNDEDILLVHLSGDFNDDPETPGFLCADQTLLAPAALGDWLIAGNKKVYTVLLLDNNPNGRDWLFAAAIVLTAGRDDKEDSFVVQVGKTNVSEFTLYLVMAFRTSPWLTYADLEQLARYLEHAKPPQPNRQRPHLSVWARDRSELNKHFLSQTVRVLDAGFLLYHIAERKVWELIREDFTTPQFGVNVDVYPYDLSSLWVPGEFSLSDGRLQLSGNTERLQPDSIYSVRVAKEPLYYQLRSNIPVYEPISVWLGTFNFSLDKFTQWDSLRQEDAQSTPTQRAGMSKLSIQRAGRAAPNGYAITWLPKGYNSIESEAITWIISSKAELDTSLNALNRYAYLTGLSLPGSPASFVPFEMAVYGYRLLNGNERDPDQQTGQGLVLDERCMTFENGRIGFRDFEIDIDWRESMTLYYDVYLVCSDLSIRKLTDWNMRLEAGKTGQHLFRDPKGLERVLTGEIIAEIKVLASVDPFNIDLSQPGVKNKPYGQE
jgi:hypothetical protein